MWVPQLIILEGMGRLSLLISYFKVLGMLLIKLVSENRTDQDEQMSTMLFSYRMAYKVATKYTPYQLMYGLHPLMPT